MNFKCAVSRAFYMRKRRLFLIKSPVYIRDNTLDNGYLVKGSVWIFEIRYEFDTASDGYKFKLFIESADSTRNGVFANYYKIK